MKRTLLLAPFLALFAACADAEVEVSAGVESGALSSRHEGEQLLVTITEVSVHVAGADGDPCDDPATKDQCDSDFIPVFTGEQSIDLFSDSAFSELLDTTKIPAGKITQIRLLLSGASWLKGELSLPVLCASCSESGLKLVTSGELAVQEGEVLSLSLIFDSELSLRFSATEARLDPVLHLRTQLTTK